VLELGVDCDHSLQSRHLQLEVGVVGDFHELHVCRTPEDRVVCSWEANDFEGERFLAEYPSSQKVTGRSICMSGIASIPGTTPWNGVDDERT
jgi:hypothetical protein